METTDQTPLLALPNRSEVLDHAAAMVLDTWRSFDQPRPDQPEASAGHRELLSEPLPQGGRDAIEVLDLAAEVIDVAASQPRPRFFSYIGSSGLEIGVLADMLMASHDINAAVDAGICELLEAQVVRWVADFVRFGDAEDGSVTSGGTVSNLSALAAARERAAPGARYRGNVGPQALYCSAEAHYSVQRAAELLGIGANNVRRIGLDDRRRMLTSELDAAIERDRREGILPVAVVATAGTTLTGAVDDLLGVARVCRERDVWFHVDGAYGLPAAATEIAGARFAGLDHADSATIDAHKWLFVPKACSVLLMRRARDLTATFSHHEGYMVHGHEQVHPVDRTLEYSRPVRALKLWLTFLTHGADAVREAIERNIALAGLLADLIRGDERFELLAAPQLSAVLFRPRIPVATDPDEYCDRLADAVNADGRIRLAAARIDGESCLRACVVNYRTTEEDVRSVPTVVGEIAATL
jgi:aromatic-L-amino-acid decarboxylase